MAASQSGYFSLQEFSDAGLLLAGGRLYTYAQGTTTFKTAYTDAAGTVPHTYTPDGIGGQYIALNARGELPAPLYLAFGSYDIALKRADGSTVWTRRADPMADGLTSALTALADSSSAAKGAGLVGFDASLNYAVGTIGAAIMDLGPSVELLGAKMNDASSGARAINTVILENALAYTRMVTIPAGTLWINETHVPSGLQLVGAGCDKTYIKGDGDLFVNTATAFGRPCFRGFSIENDATRGKLFTWDIGADTPSVGFKDVNFGKSTHHIYVNAIAVGWMFDNCRFNDANIASRYFKGLWAYTEMGACYTWYNTNGIIVDGSSSSSCNCFGSVFEYNTDAAVILNANGGDILGWNFDGAHFEGNGSSTGAPDVRLTCLTANQIRGISFNGCGWFFPSAGQTERVGISSDGVGNVRSVHFKGGYVAGTPALVTNGVYATIDPDVSFQATAAGSANLSTLVVPVAFSHVLGAASISGPSGGNGVVQAAVPPPAGTKWAEVRVQGNSYNGVANTHDGRLYGTYRASGNRVSTDVDVNNTTGSAQGWVLSYTSGAIQVANKTGLTADQSADVVIVFYG